MVFRGGFSSGGLRPHALFRDVRCRADEILIALGEARPRYFSLLAKRKVPKRKGTRRLAPRRWRGVPCASRHKTGAAELSLAIPGPCPAGAASGDNWAPAQFVAISDRSDSPRADPFSACGARLHQRDGGAPIQPSRAGLARRKLSGVARPTGCRTPDPPWCSRASQPFPETSACMSDRPQGGSSRAPETARSAGQSERSGDQAVGCRFLCLLSFGQAKERRAGALSTAHSRKTRASAQRIIPAKYVAERASPLRRDLAH